MRGPPLPATVRPGSTISHFVDRPRRDTAEYAISGAAHFHATQCDGEIPYVDIDGGESPAASGDPSDRRMNISS
jgi:hypothetical protein